MDILIKLKTIIEQKGYTINKVTELSGLSENTIYNWYNKGAEPSIHALKAVCDVLGISIASLLSDDNEQHLTYLEEEFVKRYRALSIKKQELILQLIIEMQ